MQNIFDTIIIGGGPAGMIAAGRAGELGKRVLLLEKNPTLGNKLLITGNGRCNVTNIRTDLKEIYKESGKYLFTTFAQFNVEQTLKFFNDRGMATKVENAGRVFPTSDKAQSVLDVLKQYMHENGVEVRFSSAVSKITKECDSFQIQLKSGEVFIAKSCIVATGGLSHPETGSTGEGFEWLKSLGHKIVNNDFALVPLALKDSWPKQLSGLTLQDIKLTVFCDNKKTFFQKGKILFTHFGISGPTVLNMSKKVSALLQTGSVTIMLDLFPGVDHSAVRNNLNDLLQKESNKMIKNTLGSLLPASLVASALEVCQINGFTSNHSVSREARIKLVDFMKGIPLNVEGLMGSDKAIISSGGVDINEVDFKTMESKKVKNLFLIGDVLDIDRPSGGFSLQLCWTTGYVAGSNC
jgi:predicted Rossmann fold flavoprotein